MAPQVEHVRAERDVLKLVDSPFIVHLSGVFQDENCIYFVLEYICGGEFFRHLRQRGRLAEDVAKFYAAEVLLAFEYLHSKDIVYRDLKVCCRLRPSIWYWQAMLKVVSAVSYADNW